MALKNLGALYFTCTIYSTGRDVHTSTGTGIHTCSTYIHHVMYYVQLWSVVRLYRYLYNVM